VFEDYGDNPSSLYLDHHGFVPRENPHACAPVRLVDPATDDPATDGAAHVARWKRSGAAALLERLHVPLAAAACLPAAIASAAAAAPAAAAESGSAGSGWEGLGPVAFAWLRGRSLTEAEAVSCARLADLNDATRALPSGSAQRTASQVSSPDLLVVVVVCPLAHSLV